MTRAFSIRPAAAVLEDTVTGNAFVSVSDGVVTGVTSDRPPGKVLDFPDAILVPGFIDLHTHGRMGMNTKDIGPDILEAYARTGTTALLPTYVGPVDVMQTWLRRVKDTRHAPGRCKVLGAHAEGPFIDPVNSGGISKEVCIPPDADVLDSLLAAGPLRYMTVSPFLDGSTGIIRKLSEANVVPVCGHSRGDEQVFDAAADAGLRGICHWYNNTPGAEQCFSEKGVRKPTPCDCALVDDRLFLEIICDLQHVSRVFVELAYRVKGPGRIAVVSDSIAAAGLPEGVYQHHDGRQYEIKDGGVHEVETGGRFGSCVTQPEEFRNLVETVGIPMPEAARMCSLTPARILGVDGTLGSIAAGKCADLVVLDRDTYSVREVFIDGVAPGTQ
jgi:N-acetylglucosamine-6-phosphate deacetylase